MTCLLKGGPYHGAILPDMPDVDTLRLGVECIPLVTAIAEQDWAPTRTQFLAVYVKGDNDFHFSGIEL